MQNSVKTTITATLSLRPGDPHVSRPPPSGSRRCRGASAGSRCRFRSSRGIPRSGTPMSGTPRRRRLRLPRGYAPYTVAELGHRQRVRGRSSDHRVEARDELPRDRVEVGGLRAQPVEGACPATRPCGLRASASGRSSVSGRRRSISAGRGVDRERLQRPQPALQLGRRRAHRAQGRVDVGLGRAQAGERAADDLHRRRQLAGSWRSAEPCCRPACAACGCPGRRAR